MPRKPFTLIPEKMDAVVRAALGEFARYGYSHASTNRICEQAGVSKGALFHNFHSKDNLFFHLIQDGARTAELVFRTHMETQGREMPFEAIFVNSFLVLLNYIRRNPDHYSIYLRLLYDPDIPQKDRAKGREVVQTFTTTISDTLYREGQARGLFRPSLDERLARFLFNTVITRFAELYYFPLRDPGLELERKSEDELRVVMLSLYDLLLRGIGNPAEPPAA